MAYLNKATVRMFLALSDGAGGKGKDVAARKRRVFKALAEPAGYAAEVSMNPAALGTDPEASQESFEWSPSLPERKAVSDEINAIIAAGQSGFVLRKLVDLQDAVESE